MKKKSVETTQETPIAARQIWQVPDNLSDKVMVTPEVMFIPEFGGVASNVIFTDSKEIAPREQILPIDIGGIIATFKVDVFAILNGKRIYCKETWFFSEAPKDKSPQDWIAEVHDRESVEGRKLCHQKIAERPTPFFKTVKGDPLKQVHPWKNARQVSLKLLKRAFPLVAKALSSKASQLKPSQALIADCVRLFGSYNTTVNLNDPKFCEAVADAMQERARREVRKSRVDALDWYLSNPKNWITLHALPIEEITRRANEATKLNLSTEAVVQRLSRLGLVSARKRGPRPKS